MASRLMFLAFGLIPLLGYGQDQALLTTSPTRDDFQSPIFIANQSFYLAQFNLRSRFNPSGGPSEITIDQSGVNNDLSYENLGSGNRARLRQAGNDNDLELRLLGDNNAYDISQLGNRNNFNVTEPRSNVGLTLTQNGNGNSLEQTFLPSGRGVEMRIEQSGGMRLIVTHGY